MEPVGAVAAVSAPDPFDYDQLDTVTRATVETKRDEIRTHARHIVEGVVDIGRALITVKQRLPHGQFGRWLAAEFAWSQDTAERYMNVARNLPEIPHGADFELRALYLLAAPSTPEEVRAKYLDRAASGGPVRVRDVREDLAPPPPPEPTEDTRGIFDDDEEGRAEIAAQLARADGYRARRAEEREQAREREREQLAPFRQLDQATKAKLAAELRRHGFAASEGKIIDVTGYLRPEPPVSEDVAEAAGDPDVIPEDQARIDRLDRVRQAVRAQSGRGWPTVRFWRDVGELTYYPLDHHDPDADPARIVADMRDGEELDEAEAIAADLLRWTERLVAAIAERRDQGRPS